MHKFRQQNINNKCKIIYKRLIAYQDQSLLNKNLLLIYVNSLRLLSQLKPNCQIFA